MVDHVKPDWPDLPAAYRLALLSPTELRVAALYADGCTYHQVNRYLGAGHSQLRANVLHKLGMTRTAELAEHRPYLHAKIGAIT